MHTLSKSKLMAFRQCPKRLWLHVYGSSKLCKDSVQAQARFSVGHEVGDIARKLYDPAGNGVLIDPKAEGFEEAFAHSQRLLHTGQPVFEAGFRVEGALAFADIMLPIQQGEHLYWRMVEVKSSTSVKDYHYEDAAVQSFVAKASGVALSAIALAHIDSDWCYSGNGDYRGLLIEKDLTEEAFARSEEVQAWISGAQAILAVRDAEPNIVTGKHCTRPHECCFYDYCRSQEPQARNPINWLPGTLSKELSTYIADTGIIEMSDVPDDLLNSKQIRVKTATISGQTYFDQAGAIEALACHDLPGYFMDFETIQFPVPIWAGTKPYQIIPFQFSVHRLSIDGKLEQLKPFLDLSGNDPSRAFAEALITSCGKRGPIFVYQEAFEKSRIKELAIRFPDLAEQLEVLNTRVVDLLPIARKYYYHPNQQGSWSIKKVLPAVCGLSYTDLDVQDGGMAMEAFLEAIAPNINITRKDEINRQLLDYCARDTYAMVLLWAVFTGYSIEIVNITS